MIVSSDIPESIIGKIDAIAAANTALQRKSVGQQYADKAEAETHLAALRNLPTSRSAVVRLALDQYLANQVPIQGNGTKPAPRKAGSPKY